MNLVFFDFDDTLTRLDTTFPLGAFVTGQRKMRLRLPFLMVAAGMLKVRLLSNHGFKRVFARLFMRGLTIENARQLARDFFETHLDALADEEVLGRLRAHVDRGDQVYLVSANFACLLEPLVARWSLAGVIATEVDFTAGACTGGIQGAACHQQEKLRRVVDRFGPRAVAGAVAYGNEDDAPLLGAVGTAFLIRRAKPPLLERLRRWRRLTSGPLNQQQDLTSVRTIEPFCASGSLPAVAPVDA